MADPHAPAPMPTVPGGPTVPMPGTGPGPGPRPVEPIFPFDEAQAALRAIEALIEDIGTLSTQSQTLTYGLLRDGTFHGSAADRFETAMDEANDRLVPLTTGELDADREWLVAAIATAHTRHDDYVQDLAAWERRRNHPNAPVSV